MALKPEETPGHVQHEELNLDTGRTLISAPGTPKKDANIKYCMNCDKRIRKTSRQARSYPRKIGKPIADGYLRYLHSRGKFKSKEEILNGYLCSPCCFEYYRKYRGQYDTELAHRKHRRALTDTAVPPEVPCFPKEELEPLMENQYTQDKGIKMEPQASYEFTGEHWISIIV